MAGHKANAGITALNNAMNQDAAKRREKAGMLISMIDKARNLSAKDKKIRIAEVQARTDAAENIGKLHVKKKILALGSKYPQWQAKSQELAAEIDQEVAQDKQEQAQAFRATETTKVAEKNDQLTPEQKLKTTMMFKRAAPASATMSKLENTWSKEQKKAIAQKVTKFLVDKSVRDNIVYGNVVTYLGDQVVGEFDADTLNETAPGGAQYFNSLIEVANLVVRRESGATVTPSEFAQAVYRHALSNQTLDPATLRNIQARRDADVETMGKAVGLRLKKKGKK